MRDLQVLHGQAERRSSGSIVSVEMCEPTLRRWIHRLNPVIMSTTIQGIAARQQYKGHVNKCH